MPFDGFSMGRHMRQGSHPVWAFKSLKGMEVWRSAHQDVPHHIVPGARCLNGAACKIHTFYSSRLTTTTEGHEPKLYTLLAFPKPSCKKSCSQNLGQTNIRLMGSGFLRTTCWNKKCGFTTRQGSTEKKRQVYVIHADTFSMLH